MKKIKSRLTCGFTLMETCVVLGIVLCLLLFLFPALGKFKGAGNVAKCASNLRVMGSGIVSYAADNNGRVPPGAISITKTAADGSIVVEYIHQLPTRSTQSWMYQYIENPMKVFACPADLSPVADRHMYYFDYVFNSNFFISYKDGLADPRVIHMSEVSNKILITEAIDWAEAQTWPDPKPNGGKDLGYGGALSYGKISRIISSRHSTGVNSLFGDGSVRFLSKAETSQGQYILRPEQM